MSFRSFLSDFIQLKIILADHPLDYRLDDSDLIVGDLDQLHLIYRGLTYAQVHRDEIRRSIRVRGLTFSRILIELDLTSYPWTWKVSNQKSAANLRLYLSSLRIQCTRNTVLAVICPYTSNAIKYIARPIRRTTLLNSSYDFERSREGLSRFLNDALLRF